MINSRQSILTLAILLLIPQISLLAYKNDPHPSANGNGEDSNRAAACAPATGMYDLDWNNVRTRIETGGSMWQDRSQDRAAYEVPAGGGVSALFAGALWMGGKSPDQQLKVAAVTFRAEGNDFWPGPLTAGTAEVDENTCAAYDRFFVSKRQDAERHRAYFDCQNDPDCDVDELFPDGYVIPAYFFDWPAHGNTALGQDYYLAPFYDYDGGGMTGGGNYDPTKGDYPAFDVAREIECDRRTKETRVPLYGDFNLWWVFNDKGNVHSESKGEPIGMEIRAQAFAFATNDEINSMTFYNYELINQGTLRLDSTYFGQWVDPDLGTSTDDYVGCDVQRGLGYCYNGDAYDEPSVSSPGYGEFPPAIGVDFFEGPFQDPDGKDNPLTLDYSEAIADDGIMYEGIGIGYGDEIIDNERFGMRKFMYYINGGGPTLGDPDQYFEYYNLLKGSFIDGSCLKYGGLGTQNTSTHPVCVDYMFPGESDPEGWGTQGQVYEPWTEASAGNPPDDKRFLQSAGPFTLEPGAKNNITVGVVYARASSGDPFESVKLVFKADDKAQALFDNCFEILSGPDAPDVAVQELHREVILELTNHNSVSSNYLESYSELDKQISDEATNGQFLSEDERSYKFQGYQIYQLKDDVTDISEIGDVDKVRLIATVDVQDDITQIVNYKFDQEMELPVPHLMAQGEDTGVKHSFSIKNDAFAQGDPRLVNFKTYYFAVLAYGHNEFEEYNAMTGDGQDEPYIASRKAASGPIRIIKAIPHQVAPEQGGTQPMASYGDLLPLTQIEGKGNGQIEIKMTESAEKELLDSDLQRLPSIEYEGGFSPVEVKVVDPLKIKARDYVIKLNPEDMDVTLVHPHWELYDAESEELIHRSAHTTDSLIEEIIVDEGFSITFHQHRFSDSHQNFTPLLSATAQYDDPSSPWLRGFVDTDASNEMNWIRSGSSEAGEEAIGIDAVVYDIWPPDPPSDLNPNPVPFNDPDEVYEGLLGGTWSPYCLTSFSQYLEQEYLVNVAPRTRALAHHSNQDYVGRIKDLNNIDIVLTNDQSLWTRCPVVEMQSDPFLSDGESDKMDLRDHPSVDKLGRTVAEGADASDATLNGAQPNGMSWFPGYAIDVGTGERLNMAFGEDSWMAADGGRDMIWNPSDRSTTGLGDVIAGGQHWIYVFRNMRDETQDEEWMPHYDEGAYLYAQLNASSQIGKFRTWKSCTWVGSAVVNEDYEMLSVEDGLVPNKLRISLRIARPYEKFDPSGGDAQQTSASLNHWNPMYSFSTHGLEPQMESPTVLEDALADINVVPNPYYAFSTYESNKLDNRIKITNLPEECVVTIYNVTGTMVRQFSKASPETYLDWDLKNHANVPIAGGVYIIHIDVPDIGERTLKWFGVMRPVDLDNF